MCVSLGPAEFSKTIIYVGSAVRDGKHVHVLGYQNTAKNLAVAMKPRPQGLDVKLWSQVVHEGKADSVPAGNAMILPFPAAVPMGKANVLDTSKCRNILKNIAEAVKPKSKGFRMGSFGVEGARSVEIFDTGIYTVVLARDPRDIPAALSQVPVEKRPALKPEIFAAYVDWYPGWQIALCCFSNADAIDADPLLWVYEPAFPDVFFAPTLDSHDGGVPDLEARVQLDHTIAFGKARNAHYEDEIGFTDEMPRDVEALMPSRVVGAQLSTRLGNGDFLVNRADVESDRFTPDRIRPGANPSITL